VNSIVPAHAPDDIGRAGTSRSSSLSVSDQRATNRSTTHCRMLYASWYGCAPSIRWGAFRTCTICTIANLGLTRSLSRRFGWPFIRRLMAEAVVDSSMSGSRLHPIVINEMFRRLVSRLGRAVTAGVTSPHARLTNICDLLQATGQGPDRLATPPSMDSAP
jgi:hypothetical protein